MPWAARRRSPARSSTGAPITCWGSTQQGVPGGEGVGTVLPATPRASRYSTPSTTVMARRRVFVCPQATSLEALRAWPGLHTVLAVETIRGVTGSGKVEAEIRYFLSSCGDDAKVLVQAIRRHWTIENGLHWVDRKSTRLNSSH